MAKRVPTEVTLKIRRMAKIVRLEEKIKKAEAKVAEMKDQLNELTVE